MIRVGLLGIGAGGAALAVLTLLSGAPRVAAFELLVVALGVVAVHDLAPVLGDQPWATGHLGTERDVPPSLARVERLVAFGHSNAADAVYRLLPELRSLAQDILSDRDGIDLQGQPDAARAALGHPAWDLLQRDPPADPDGPGVDLESLDLLVASLEQR